MKRYSDVWLQSLSRFGSLGPSKTTLKELKQRHFVNFQTILLFYVLMTMVDTISYMQCIVYLSNNNLQVLYIFSKCIMFS